ncbi:MAG: GldG family protein [Clostridiales bacterium]|nr:GldG family protein [Clostridiales bacterium]
MKKNDKDLLNQGILDTDLASEQEEIKSRKLKYSTIATVFTVLFIAAVVVVNIFIGYLTDRYVLEIDLTSERLFEISEDTKEVIDDLRGPITITVLAQETTYKDSTELLSNIYEVLQRYQSLSGGKITVRYIDPNLNPAMVDKYNALNDVSSNDIIVESPLRFKRLAPTSLYNYEKDENGVTYYIGLRAEQKLTSALLFVTSETLDKAMYIRGHGEDYSMDELDSLLTTANYDVDTLILAQAEIPDDCTLLIISSPTMDYSVSEIDKLAAYLEDGGRLIVSLTPNAVDPLTNLSLLFEEYGVKYEDSMILDSSQSLSGYPMYVVPTLMRYEGITDNLNSKNTFLVIPACKPISLTGTQRPGVVVTPLLTSSATSYAKSFEDVVAIQYDQAESDAVGPFNMAVLAERIFSDKNLNYNRTEILFCSAGMITDSILSAPEFLNATYLTTALNYIVDYSEAVIIPDKEFESTALTLLSWQADLILWLVIIGIPVIVIAVGIIVWVRRRHL